MFLGFLIRRGRNRFQPQVNISPIESKAPKVKSFNEGLPKQISKKSIKNLTYG